MTHAADNDMKKEQDLILRLSSLVDGECDAAECDRMIERLCSDARLRDRWERYHLIGDIAKNQAPDQLSLHFSERMRSAIAEEPAHRGARQSDARIKVLSVDRLKRWWGDRQAPAWTWAAPVAAAAVTVAIVLPSLSLFDVGPRIVEAEPPAAALPAASEVVSTLDEAPMRDDARFNRYLVDHNELASASSVHGVLPYVRMVAYGDGQ